MTSDELTVKKASGNLGVLIEADDGLGTMEVGGSTGAFIDLKTPISDDFDLRVNADGTLTSVGNLVVNVNNNETGFRVLANGACELYYDNVKEFETKSGGVKLLGHSEQAVNALGNTTGSTTIDFSVANIITATLTGATTFANPTTESVGQSGSIIVTQDGTGSRTLAWGTQFKWTGGTAPTLSTAANAVDRIDYLVVAADQIHCVASLDVK